MKCGYLLMNVMVVVAIIGFMATLSIPYIRNFQPTMELNAAKKEITSDLRSVQQTAVTQQVVYAVKFHVDQSGYEIIKGLENATSTVKYVELPPGIDLEEIFDSDDDKVEFNFYGGVDESCQVILSNSQGKTGRVNIKPSGYIEMQ